MAARCASQKLMTNDATARASEAIAITVAVVIGAPATKVMRMRGHDKTATDSGLLDPCHSNGERAKDAPTHGGLSDCGPTLVARDRDEVRPGLDGRLAVPPCRCAPTQPGPSVIGSLWANRHVRHGLSAVIPLSGPRATAGLLEAPMLRIGRGRRRAATAGPATPRVPTPLRVARFSVLVANTAYKRSLSWG
jgi:hypothetical protein